jgi:hypothetical protein
VIIHVERKHGGMYRVRPLNDDGSKIERDGNDVPWRESICGHGLVWDRVGELIAREKGADVVVRYNPAIDVLEPLSYAPDFAISYEVRPGVLRYWREQGGQIFSDRDGWLQGPTLQGAQPVLSVAYWHGPLIEVADDGQPIE